MTLTEQIGQRIRELREAKGWSQHDLACAAETCQNYISEVERGKRGLAPKSLQRIGKALGCVTTIQLIPDRGTAHDTNRTISRSFSEFLRGGH